MGTSAYITLVFKDGVEHYFYTHYDGGYQECGNKLWYFLRLLTAEQWTVLQTNLQRRTKWVGENDLAKKEDHEQYSWKYCWSEDVGKPRLRMKEMFGRLKSCPAHTLNEVLHGRLQHMIRDPTDDYSDFDYKVDFALQSLSVLQEDGQTWTKVPFITDQEADVLFQYEVEEDPWTKVPSLSSQEFDLLQRFQMRENKWTRCPFVYGPTSKYASGLAFRNTAL